MLTMSEANTELRKHCVKLTLSWANTEDQEQCIFVEAVTLFFSLGKKMTHAPDETDSFKINTDGYSNLVQD